MNRRPPALAHRLLALAAIALAAPADDPVAGVWKGLATGDGATFPTWGVPATFLLERAASGQLAGTFTLQGTSVEGVSGAFDAASGELALAGTFAGTSFAARVRIAGDRMTGDVTGLGTTLSVDARRIGTQVLAPPPGRSSAADVRTLSAEAWAADLAFLGAYLPQVHANAFHVLEPASWNAAIEALAKRAGELDGPRMAVALAQLVARVGDAHTELDWRELPGFDACPVGFTRFADGLFVSAVDERWAEALGARVLRVASVDAEEALARVCTLFAAENESWRRAKGPALLAIPRLLWSLWLVESPDRLPIVVEGADGELALELEPRGSGAMLQAPDPEHDPLPLWQTRRNESYWFERLAGKPAVYLAYNRCAEDPRRPIEGFVTDVLAAVEDTSAERLVIDLRHNAGGNSAVLSHQLERLAKHPRLCEPGRVVALIGPTTYSSGMMNAHQLRAQVGATLVGEPTGGKPNSYGEMRSFRLPSSGLAVYYSTKYFRMLADDPPAVEPDVRVDLASYEAFAREDPVLARALELGRERR